MSTTPTPIPAHVRNRLLTTPPPAYQHAQQNQHTLNTSVMFGDLNISSSSQQQPVFYSPSPLRQLMAARSANSALPPVRVEFGGPLNCEVDILSPAHFAQQRASATAVLEAQLTRSRQLEEQIMREKLASLSLSPAGSGVFVAPQSSQSRRGSLAAVASASFNEHDNEQQQLDESSLSMTMTTTVSGLQQRSRSSLSPNELARQRARDKARLERARHEEQQKMLSANRDAQWEERRELVNQRLYSEFGPQGAIFKRLFMEEDIRTRKQQEAATKATRRRDNILLGRVPPPQEQPPIPKEVFEAPPKRRKLGQPKAHLFSIEDADNLEKLRQLEQEQQQAEVVLMSREEIEEIERAQFQRTGFSPMFSSMAEVRASAKRQRRIAHHNEKMRAEEAERQNSSASGGVAELVPESLRQMQQQQQQQSSSSSPSAMLLVSPQTASKLSAAATANLMTPTLTEGMSVAVSEQTGGFEQERRNSSGSSSSSSSSPSSSTQQQNNDDEDNQNTQQHHTSQGDVHEGEEDDEEEDPLQQDDSEGEEDIDGAPRVNRLPPSYQASVRRLLQQVHLSRPETQKHSLARTMQRRGCEMNSKRHQEAEDKLRRQNHLAHGTAGGGDSTLLAGTGWNLSNTDRNDPSYSATAAFVARRLNQKSLQEEAMDGLTAITTSAYVDEITDKFTFFKQALVPAARRRIGGGGGGDSHSNSGGDHSSHSSLHDRPSVMLTSHELKRKLPPTAAASSASVIPLGSMKKRPPSEEGRSAPGGGRRHLIGVGSQIMLGGKPFTFDESMRI